jgi:hypothetical protein
MSYPGSYSIWTLGVSTVIAMPTIVWAAPEEAYEEEIC